MRVTKLLALLVPMFALCTLAACQVPADFEDTTPPTIERVPNPLRSTTPGVPNPLQTTTRRVTAASARRRLRVPHRRARDDPGGWYHVMNRAIARRTMFERRADIRTFLAALARCVRRGWLEVHAYTLLNTHYHMLVRSPVGRLADSMQRVQLTYSRAFNRGRHRDGPLVRGRYRSKRVSSLGYRRVLVAYIDANPVRAGIVGQASAYPYGSAWHYARRSGPLWLERSWVESEVRAASGQDFEPSGYRAAFGVRVPSVLHRLVGARIVHGSLEDPLDEILGARPEQVAEWMRRKALLADGTRPGLPVSDLATVERSIEASLDASKRAGERIADNEWRAMTAGLAQALTSCTQAQIAASLDCSPSWAGELIRAHRRRIVVDASYAARAAEIARGITARWERW